MYLSSFFKPERSFPRRKNLDAFLEFELLGHTETTSNCVVRVVVSLFSLYTALSGKDLKVLQPSL